MDELTKEQLSHELRDLGFNNIPELFYNIPPAQLVEIAVKNNEGLISETGALTVNTSPYTGRSPKDKYYVDHNNPDIWLSEGAQKISPQNAISLKSKMIDYLCQNNLYIRDVVVGAHPKFQTRIRVITDTAWQSLLSSNLFINQKEYILPNKPEFTILVANGFEADPEVDHTRSKAFIILDIEDNYLLVGATEYGGEIKKSVFTLMNYLMPKNGILSMHCSANQGKDGDVALFFGLSGTGKTTLSSDVNRALIGDDEHGWGEEGIFNFEGGCYAKTIRLNPQYEPLVWSAINRFRAILENVPLDKYRHPDFNDNSITENTRAAYPIHFIPNSVDKGFGGHPSHVFLLTADAFGVLPPLAKLSMDQALYYFISGYTSKLAGTERGLGQEPEATFSACFGAPFLPLHPGVYSKLLGERLKKYNTKVWLLNTGWIGGGYGVGQRISLPYTRAMISAVLNNELNDVPTFHDKVFNLDIPINVNGVPEHILDPQSGWSDKDAYLRQAQKLAKLFKDNYANYDEFISSTVKKAGPN